MNNEKIRLKDLYSTIGDMMKWTSSMPDREVYIDVDGKLYEIAMVGGGGSRPIAKLYARTESLSARLAHLEGRASEQELEAHNQSHQRALVAIAALNLPKMEARANMPLRDHLPRRKPHCDLPSEHERRQETPEIEHR